jgi:hypothetical protein
VRSRDERPVAAALGLYAFFRCDFGGYAALTGMNDPDRLD